MFGAVYGDVIGSYYEVHCTKNYSFPFEKDSSFTDDSVLIAAVCKTILNDPSEIGKFGLKDRSQQYAAQYRQFYSWFPYAGFENGYRWRIPRESIFVLQNDAPGQNQPGHHDP